MTAAAIQVARGFAWEAAGGFAALIPAAVDLAHSDADSGRLDFLTSTRYREFAA